MNKTLTKGVMTILSIGLLIPFVCSCSSFKKKAVLARTIEFTDALRVGDVTDILQLTDGLDRDYKKDFKDFMNVSNYDDEELTYAAAMMDTMSVDINDSSVSVKKETATVDIEVTIADYQALQDGNYIDADDLARAVKSGKTRTIPITVEFALVEKEWYVTNFNDKEFRDIYSFLNYMPVIGRGTLIDTAKVVADSVINDDPSLALGVTVSLDSPDMIDMSSYLDTLFDVNGKPTDEQKTFRAAVLSTMTYEIDETGATIEGHNGSFEIRITMADYTQLANQNFKKITDIAPAVEKLPTVTYSFTCKFVRSGADWYATNLDAEEFADILRYKSFSIALKKTLKAPSSSKQLLS